MKQHTAATVAALAALTCAAGANAQRRGTVVVVRPAPRAPQPVVVHPAGPPRASPVYVQPGPPRPSPAYVQPGPPRPAPVYVQPPRPSPVVVAPPPPRPATVVVRPMPIRPLPTATPIRVRVAPPPMRTEMMSRSPGPGYIWVAGNWHWDGTQYIWIPGHWDLPPHPQAAWVPARWVVVNGYYEYQPGRWQYGNAYPATYVQPAQPVVQQPMAYTLERNTRVEGMLQQGDQILQHAGYGDDYALNLVAGETVTVIASGGPSYTRPGNRLDVFMQVLQNGTVVAQDDDSAGNLDARIDFVAQSSGVYVVRVTNYSGNYEQGAYTLQNWVQSPQPQPVVQVQPAQPQPVVQVQPAQPQTYLTGMLQVNGVASGSLDPTDARLQDGSAGDDYGINLTAGQPVTIIVRGGPASDGSGGVLDVYAVLLFNGQELTHDDDSAGYPNSRIVFTPQVSGMYTLRVTTFGSGFHGGAYTVQTWAGAYDNAQ